MKTRMTVLTMLVVVAVAAAPLGTEFTYQGVLSDAGSPASGDFDFRLFLYNADAGGSQVGPMVLIEDVTVTDGRFTTQLDFGSVFDGTALWLEVGVRDGGSGGGYTVLQPRQELTAAPFAQHAASSDVAMIAGHAATADFADWADDSDFLNGQHGIYYLAWSNFTGIPGDLADGDDDTLADLSCGPDEIARWTGSAWNCSSDDDTPYFRTFVVGPVGTPTENGTALRNALSAITPPTSEEEAILLKLEPGVYDLEAFGIEIWGWMTVEGAGEPSTLITAESCDPSYYNPTVRLDAASIGLRRLSVENSCADSGQFGIAIAIDWDGDFATLERVTASVDGAALTNLAIRNMGSDLKMDHVTATAENGINQNSGLFNGGQRAELEFVTAVADGGNTARAIANNEHNFTLRHGILKADGSGICTALANTGDNLILQDVVADASPLTCSGQGISSQNASGTLSNVRAAGRVGIWWTSTSSSRNISMHDVRAEGFTDGISCLASGSSITLHVDDSWVQGGLTSITNQAAGCTVRVWSSFLDPEVSGGATCIAVYNGSTFYPNTCP